MNDSEKRRRQLLEETRSLYSDRNSPPAVHPRYKFAYARLYGSEDEMAPGTFGLRLFLCFMLFAAFVAMDKDVYKRQLLGRGNVPQGQEDGEGLGRAWAGVLQQHPEEHHPPGLSLIHI